MSRQPRWLSVLIALLAPGVVNFCSSGGLWQPRCLSSQRNALVTQTVLEKPEVLPKSHLSGALQRVLGRDVYKSETPFFYRTTETKSFYYALLRIPALPKKNPDGSNYIPARTFHYCSGRGPSLEEAEQDAARKALKVIRNADSEMARWLSWSASTSKQALEVVASQMADARPTDGQARRQLNRALAVMHGRLIKAHEIRYFMKDDPSDPIDEFHVVLRVPWQQNRTYYFEGSGLTSILAKESAAEAALKILRPMISHIEDDMPWQKPQQGKGTARKATRTAREAALDKEVPAKIRIYQLLDFVMTKTERHLDRKDLVYTTRRVLPEDADVPEDQEVKVWESDITEVRLTVPPLQPRGEKLTFSKRVPSWKRAPDPDNPEHFRTPYKKKRFYQLKAQARQNFLEAQQAVADVAVDEILKLLPEDFFDKSEPPLLGSGPVQP